MKTLIPAALAALCLAAAPLNPISWKAEIAPAKPLKPGARFTLKVAAQIQEGWHLYSMKPLADGPIPTRIWIAEGQPFELAGPVTGPPPETVQDPNFNMEVEFYQGQATFTVPARVAAKAPAGPQKLEISASYQSCNDKLCLPPRTVKIEAVAQVAK